jgi:hypothetical protein
MQTQEAHLLQLETLMADRQQQQLLQLNMEEQEEEVEGL